MKHIGLGTAAIGRPSYINIREEQTTKQFPFDRKGFKREGKLVLDAALELGINYFDTAPGYGLAEELVLDWVKNNESDKIEVATKWGYTYTANFDPNAKVHEVKEHSLKKLNEQWDYSQQLKPNLSIYQIHSATFDSGVLINQLVLERLGELKEKYGLLIGLTSSGNNQTDVLAKALEIEVNGKPLFEAFQVTYNIFDQSISKLADQLTNGKKLIIKEALANGRVFRNKSYPNYTNAYSAIERLAKKYKVGIDAICLRFCIDSLHPYKVLSGASNKEQLIENCKAETFQLTNNELGQLKELQTSPNHYWNERKRMTWN